MENDSNNSELEFRKIKSLNNKYEVNANGTIFRNAENKKELKIKLDMHHSKSGYYTTFIHVNGRRPDSKIIRVPIHKVVAECWLGEKPEGLEIDHIDRNSRNNDYKNLRYVTKSEQMKNRNHENIARRGSQNLQEAREQRAKGLTLIKDDERYRFESMSEASRFIADNSNLSYDQAKYRITADNIHEASGYTIIRDAIKFIKRNDT